MEKELLEEIEFEIATLIFSGFYREDEILEIIEEQFIDEDISIDSIEKIISLTYSEKIAIEKEWSKYTDFDKLKECFKDLAKEKIIAIHNAGYTLTEGIEDSFQVFYYLHDKKLKPEGFCFYHFQDVERAIESNSLTLAFGDFENSEEKALKIGKKIVSVLIKNGFTAIWNEDINKRIEIKPFHWKKRLDEEEYEMEGAVALFLKYNS